MNRPSTLPRFDPLALRQAFPIFAVKPHGKPLHYMDNAATAQIPRAVLDAMYHHETTARANVKRSVHYLAETASEAFDNARRSIARYVNAPEPEEIIFTSGCTAAINLVAHSLGATLAAGDEVIISALEHHSNIVPWHLLAERQQIRVKAIPITTEGRIDIDALEALVSERTRLIALTHASNVTGAITDISRITAKAKAFDIKVMLDGAQIAPHGNIDVQALGIDFYAFSGHKMFGPNGIGVLWGRDSILRHLPPFMGGGEMIRRVTLEKSTYAESPHRFEAGTPAICQAVGLSAAAEWISGLDLAAAHAHLDRLTDKLLKGLSHIERVSCIGPNTVMDRLPVVSFKVIGAHPHDICQILDRHGVALRGGHHCAQPLMDAFGITGTVRASLAYYNDESDIDALLDGLTDAIGKLCR